jgi:hypothetical protein
MITLTKKRQQLNEILKSFNQMVISALQRSEEAA